eukprot:GFUD01021585.1.p1 GENE.GFUD01021585.1~~GFUD01021585.1.p1  ORF type:complete len:1011 (+),score=180.09 GFUD01021585.1:96-3128(+)
MNTQWTVTLTILLWSSRLAGDTLDMECPRSDQECRDQELCSSFQREKNQLRLASSRNENIKEKFFELTALVCNRVDRKVCCSDSKEKDSLCNKKGDECKSELLCPTFKEKKKHLKMIGKGTPLYKTSLEDLKGAVCNKQERKVCCSPLCSGSEVLIGEDCVKQSNVWTCHGENMLRHIPCNDQPCTNMTYKSGSGDKSDISIPCLGDGKCPNDRCLVESVCEYRLGFYSCGSTCQNTSVPCNGECPLEYDREKVIELCQQDGECKPVPKDHYSCGGTCLHESEPCRGGCDRVHKYTNRYSSKVLYNGTCISPYKVWECNGKNQLKTNPCKLTEDILNCPYEFCLDATKTSCERKFCYFTCGNICQNYEVPCKDECPDNWYLVNGTCLSGFNVWDCNGEFIHRNTPCTNETEPYCHKSYVLFEGGCKSTSDLWQCNGQYQSEETPCNINDTLQCKDEESFRRWCLVQTEGKCKNTRIHDLWICDTVCIPLSTPCQGECGERGVHLYKMINGSCVDEELTWKCKGEDQLLSIPCNDGLQCPVNYCLEEVSSHPNQLLISSTGGARDKQAQLMGVFDKLLNITRFNLPVYRRTNPGAVSYLFYYDKFWKIGGDYDKASGGIATSNKGAVSPVQVVEWFYWDGEWLHDSTLTVRQAAAGKKMSEFLPVGGTCKPAYSKDKSCNAFCQPWSFPCDGLCATHLCLVDGQCVYAPIGYYSCGSVCQPLTVPCKGRCPHTDLDDSRHISSRTFLIEDTCVYGSKDHWVCDEKNYFKETPCTGKCPDNRILVGEKCEMPENTWVCGEGNNTLGELCQGLCPEDHFLWNEKCILNKSGWECDGMRQPLSVPCNNSCSLISEKSYMSGPNTLTDYVNCQGVCRLREDVRGCDGGCIDLSTPCGGECEAGHVFTGDGCVDIGISLNYEWIVLRGEMVLSQFCSCRPWSHCCAAKAFRRYFSSAISAISVTSIVAFHSGLVETKQGSLIAKGTCPPLYCSVGKKCCLIAWGGQNRGLVCPERC